jgi:hypothetical protein
MMTEPRQPTSPLDPSLEIDQMLEKLLAQQGAAIRALLPQVQQAINVLESVSKMGSMRQDERKQTEVRAANVLLDLRRSLVAARTMNVQADGYLRARHGLEPAPRWQDKTTD